MNADISEIKSEYSRVKRLNDFDLDYFKLQDDFQGLVTLAASIAGTKFSNLNLIDNYFQWTVASHGTATNTVMREESVCDLAIKKREPLEIQRLDRDERFMNRSYVSCKDGLKYYLGIPLTLNSGENIGALCVFDIEEKTVLETQVEQLKLIAVEIVSKLELMKRYNHLEFELSEAEKNKNRLAHDVRSPISGIAQLCQFLQEEEVLNREFASYLQMINESGNGILELTKNILDDHSNTAYKKEQDYNLLELGQRLTALYALPAKTGNLSFSVDIEEEDAGFRFSAIKLLSAIGNLISNAIKFTPSGGWVKVTLELITNNDEKKLIVLVSDNGVGIDNTITKADFQESNLDYAVLHKESYGLGLQLVKEVVEKRKGQMNLDSNIYGGTTVKLEVPIN
jgi:K+-sensing histidine kinase KdpD